MSPAVEEVRGQSYRPEVRVTSLTSTGQRSGRWPGRRPHLSEGSAWRWSRSAAGLSLRSPGSSQSWWTTGTSQTWETEESCRFIERLQNIQALTFHIQKPAELFWDLMWSTNTRWRKTEGEERNSFYPFIVTTLFKYYDFILMFLQFYAGNNFIQVFFIL